MDNSNTTSGVSVGATPATIDFSNALACMKSGQSLARLGWNGKGMWVTLQTPDQNSKMTLPYFYMSVVGGSKVPWVASHSDILGEDWYVVVV